MSYPLAKVAGSPGGVTTNCRNCGMAIVVSRWDDMNGFLVECPRCHRFHGKRWTAGRIMLAAMICGPIALFFILRPSSALRAFGAWFVLWMGAFAISTAFDAPNPALETMSLVAAYLLPVFIGFFAIWRHERDLRADRVYDAVVVREQF